MGGGDVFGACVLSAAVACGSFFGAVGGVWLRMGQTLGRAAELVAEWQQGGQRVSNGLALCRTWGGCRCYRSGRRRRTTSPNISAEAAEQLRTPGTLPAVRLFSSPFKRSLLHIHKTITKQTQFQQSLRGAAEYIYNLHARRIYNILHERAIIILYLHAHPRAPVPLFFFFLFFLIPFLLFSFLLSFLFSFLLYYFSFRLSFRLSFRFSSFPFLLFRFSFFLSLHFCNRSGGGKGLAFPPPSSFVGCLRFP